MYARPSGAIRPRSLNRRYTGAASPLRKRSTTKYKGTLISRWTARNHVHALPRAGEENLLLLLNRRSRLQPGLCRGRIAKHREARIEVRAENRIHARHSEDHVVRGHEGRGPKGVAMAELAQVTHELPDLPSSHVRRSVARIDQLGYAKSVRRLLALQVSENVMQRDVAARGGAQHPLVRYVFDFERHRGLPLVSCRSGPPRGGAPASVLDF